ncbi:MAG TPA: ABC transporter substrate-binding protein [Dehalococcoidales bacterium]|nr:ABC transporter substrate-binding protein [Dehalococcoidales bacterium]
MLKKIIHILLACSLLMLLVAAGCGTTAEEAKVIKIGVIGPMQFVQGEHHWYGATMARDKINDAGGVTIDGEEYTIELIKTDSNEMLSPTDAATAMERLITVDKADFVVGGFRTEAVFPMQDVAMEYKTIFLGCGAATYELNTRLAEDYDTFKYWFRVTPFHSNNLVANSLATLGLAGAIMQGGLGLEGPLKVAILGEGAQWADGMVGAYEAYVPAMLGMEVVGTWRPSPTATDLTAELTAIEASGAHFILTIISGPIGIPYAKGLGELEIPVASVGINVEAQKDGFWDATGGYGNYETTLNTYAKGIAVTEYTIPFFDAFMEEYGQTPTYNAGTYDAILLLTEAIERAGTLDSDAVVVELKKTDFVGTGGRITFTGQDADNPHDVVYGPGFVTGLATQWQDGEMKAVWPWGWNDITYEGTVQWQIPDRVIKKYAK